MFSQPISPRLNTVPPAFAELRAVVETVTRRLQSAKAVNDTARWLKYCDTLLTMHSDNPEGYIERAQARFVTGDLSGAGADATQALALIADQQEGYRYDEPTLTQAELVALTRAQYPTYLYAYLIRAQARAAQEDTEGSVADAKAVLEQVGQRIPVFYTAINDPDQVAEAEVRFWLALAHEATLGSEQLD